ncbi:hypothetical protein SCREM1_220 [Synechococcus phage S-CREM1]|nr:hypothetical protein SCREM1_220 [Synechococcus phage S-CREM1]
MKSFAKHLQERKYSDKEKEIKLSGGKSTVKINPDSESLKEADIKPPMERLKTDRNMFSIPADEREAAKQRLLAKAAAKRKQKEMGEQTMMSFSQFMEARRMDKEGMDRGDSARAERAEKAKSSLAARAKRQKVLDKHEKQTGNKLDISRSKEGKEHAKNFPGSRQAPKVKGAKETASETQNRRIKRSNERKVKHGFTSKERKEAESMAKHTSRFD